MKEIPILLIGLFAMLAMAMCVIFFVVLYQRRVIQSQIVIKKISEEKQQELLNASIKSEENERMRIATELHDDIAPTLASIKLYLSSAIKSSNNPELIMQSKELLDESLKKIRNISHKLQPSTLLYLGLQVSLQAYADMINNSGGIQVTYHSKADTIRLSPDVELSIYRIVQELINNIIKHSYAVAITIEINREKKDFVLQILHDGNGMTQENFLEHIYKKGAIGLKNIVTRLKSINSEIDFKQLQPDLFSIVVKVPVTQEINNKNDTPS